MIDQKEIINEFKIHDGDTGFRSSNRFINIQN